MLRTPAIWVALSLAIGLGCGGGDKKPDATKKDASDAAPSAAGKKDDDNADDKKVADGKTDAKEADAKKAPEGGDKDAAAGPPDEWLVWFLREGRFTTRWVDAARSEGSLIAERHALVVSDGRELWEVARHDATVDVMECPCMDDERAPGCNHPSGTLDNTGLKANALVGGGTVDVHPPDTELLYGGDISVGISIQGGVGSKLFYRWTNNGYFCGAHGLYESGDVIYDLAKKDSVDPWEPVNRGLPAKTREAAAKELRKVLVECDGPDDASSMQEVLDSVMQLAGLHVGLKDGTPKITWDFEAEVYYACSPDYAASSQQSTGLDAAAAPMGLGAPIPEGLGTVLAGLGSATTVGWSKLEVSGPAREAALAAFAKASEDPWPPSVSNEKEPKGATAEATAQAKVRLNAGRKLTRAKDYVAAIAEYDAALALDPKLAQAWSERGYAKLLKGDLVEAKDDLEHALPFDEGNNYRASVHYNLGLVAEKQGDLDTAKSEFSESVHMRPNATVSKALERVGGLP
ncbi:MAG: tetratricopeptide repeat protein [Myxococcota bacterium]